MANDFPPDIDRRMADLLFSFAMAAPSHLGTDDLVVILDLTDGGFALNAQPRATMLEIDDVQLRAKIGQPASEARQVLGTPQCSYWLLVLRDDSATCVAVNASMMEAAGVDLLRPVAGTL